jgi:hypothetical protein
VIVHTIQDGFERLGVLRRTSISQNHRGVVMLAVRVDGRPTRVALDYADDHHFVNTSALEESDLYFKMQYRHTGYDDARIVRGGYTVTGRDFYRYMLSYRRLGAGRRRISVYGRFGYQFQGEFRRQAVHLLESAEGVGFVGGGQKVRYSRFLREPGKACLALHMPGNGVFTHRVAEFLGLGTCMLSVRFATDLHVPLEPGVHYVDFAEDLGDLVDKARYYLHHDGERERIASAGAEFFDRYLHCEQLVGYYIAKILDRLSP